jgi:hypothetical protein
MTISESQARAKWCPFVRIDGDNRLHNTMTDGFANSEKRYHCIASDCMGWREFHLSFYKGDAPEKHGYCGYAGRPEGE